MFTTLDSGKLVAYIENANSKVEGTTIEQFAKTLFRPFHRPLRLQQPRSISMIKATILYANEPGAQFDHVYYKDRHLPLIQSRMGSACKYYAIDKGISGAGPEVSPPFIAMCHIFSNSADEFWAAVLPHFDEINGDVSNFTNIKLIIQISEVVVDRNLP